MNTLEHNQIERETIDGLRFGVVIKNADTEGMKRVKARVKGVFERPVQKEHIPWAYPVFDFDVPTLGTEVCVIFENGDIERPWYFPKGYLDKDQYTEITELYATIVQRKKDMVVSNIDVINNTFSEPSTESTGEWGKKADVSIYPEDIATEDGEGINTGSPQTGTMIEILKEQGKEEVSTYHSTGTYIDIRKDGTVVIHSVKDICTIVEGEANSLVQNNALVRVNGDVELRVEGAVSIQAAGNLQIDSPNVMITGGTLQVDGTAAASGSGPFCALPNCIFSGTPHIGNVVSGT